MLDIEKRCIYLFQKYEKLEEIFGNFFLSLFSCTQVIVVLMTFLRKGFFICLFLLLLKSFLYVVLLGSSQKLMILQNFQNSSTICLWFVFIYQI